jgi:hypothetical protein
MSAAAKTRGSGRTRAGRLSDANHKCCRDGTPVGIRHLSRILPDKPELGANGSGFLDLSEVPAPSAGRVPSGRGLGSQIRAILLEVDPRTHLGKVRLNVDDDPAIRVGLAVTIDVSRSLWCFHSPFGHRISD